MSAIHDVIDFENIALYSVRTNSSWFPSDKMSGVSEMLIADYEKGDDFSRSFERIANLYSAAAAMSVFAQFMKPESIMALYKKCTENQ